jgi:hypothetical protein
MYFKYSSHEADAWQECVVTTIVGRQNFKFREGQATIVLLGVTPSDVQMQCTLPQLPEA